MATKTYLGQTSINATYLGQEGGFYPSSTYVGNQGSTGSLVTSSLIYNWDSQITANNTTWTDTQAGEPLTIKGTGSAYGVEPGVSYFDKPVYTFSEELNTGYTSSAGQLTSFDINPSSSSQQTYQMQLLWDGSDPAEQVDTLTGVYNLFTSAPNYQTRIFLQHNTRTIRFNPFGLNSSDGFTFNLGYGAKEWFNVAITVDYVAGGTSTYTCYYNGTQVGQITSSRYYGDYVGGVFGQSQFTIGNAIANVPSDEFNGSVRQFAYYGTLLTPSEIQSNSDWMSYWYH